MGRNHLPGGVDLETIGRPLFAETTYDGVGFGLGLSVVLDPVANKVPASPGEVAWGGAASTAFWVDRAEGVIAGLTLATTPAELVRAGMEAVAYRLARIYERLKPLAAQEHTIAFDHGEV